MRLPLLVLVAISVLSLLVPVPKRYVDDGSIIRETLAALRVPATILRVVLHPASVSPLVYYLLLRAIHFLLSIPVRLFLSGFGLNVRSFSGTSFSGLLLTVRIRDAMEVIIRVDEVGVDIRTMRRFRMRLRAIWMQLRNHLRARRGAAPVDTPTDSAPMSPRPSADSQRSMPEPTCKSGDSTTASTGSSSSSSSALSKRIQLYARGVHVQLFAVSPKKPEVKGEESLWFDVNAADHNHDETSAQANGAATATKSPADGSSGEEHVLDSEAQEIAAKLAKRLSTLLRTYAYFASLFAHWVDLSVADVSLMLVHSSDMARAGRGITLHISSLLMWAESARESHGRNGAGAGWIPTDIKNSLLGIVDWLLRMLKLRRNDDLHTATRSRMPSVDLPNSRIPSTRTTFDGPRPSSSSSSFMPKRDRSHKYLSTLALEVSGIRLFPGIDGAQQHMNSRWELVKMLVVQDMMPPRNSRDSDKPHSRGPVVNCQRCTIRNDVITTFWGLPKKVDQSIELGQTHIRAGTVEALLDEIAIMFIAPATRTSDLSIHGLRALNSHLASILRQYNSRGASPGDVLSDSAESTPPQDRATPGIESDKQEGAAEAKEQVHRMLFQLHEILSRLRLEHVGFALRVADLVFDLPLTCKTGSLIVKAPGMLRWRQRNIEVEAGYMWNAISSGPESTVSEVQLDTEKESDSSDDGEKGGLHYSWPGGVDDMFAREFEGQTSRRSKDSTAFVRLATGHCQATALRTPSMTPDPRAEELLPDSPGFRMRYCTLYGEMSAFLSEDLAQRPSPQPVFSLDVGRPELSLDLCTQLAFNEAQEWLDHVEYRFRAMRRILKTNQPLSGGMAGANIERAINHRVYALVSLIFSDIKAHVTIERAMYAVRPHVPLVSQESKSAASEERIALRMHHLECHLLWNLTESGGYSTSDANGSDSDSEAGGFATGRESVGNSPSMSYRARSRPNHEPVCDGLAPSIQFRLTSSPITAQWSSSALPSETDVPGKTLLRIKHGVRARGTVDLRIGPAALRNAAPRINANIDAEIGEVSGRLREYDFRKWLSMQPLWLVTELLHVAEMDYNNSGSRYKASREAATASTSYVLPSLEARRKRLTATLHMVFESIRVTILACDNEEDVRSGIEHGTQLCFQHGLVDIRANGGSLESPHPFGSRSDVGQTTLNIECQKATMFLISAIPTQSAREEIRQSSESLPAGFALSDLDGFLPDTVQAHIVLVSPQFNFSRQKLEPFRSRLIFDLKTTKFAGVTSVSSIYRWSVFMRHIQYWLRRKRLARRMATQMEVPSPPDDLIVSINSEMLDLRGSLVSPMFFNLDKGLAKCFQAAKDEREASSRSSPEMKLKMPNVQFAVERTKLGTDNDMKILLSGPIATFYGSSTPKGQAAPCCPQPLMSLKECRFTFSLPRKAKREKLGAEQGVRCNSSYNKIDVVFERGAMAFGHQYNMAETIDGFILLQKGCKRIARKSTSTCHPPLPFLEAALDKRPTNKMVLAALGNPRTFMPPPLRSLSSVKPPPPPMLSEPEDIPTIDFHGPEFSMMVHDDPFETALSRIYQVGLHEQRERLNRLESFETKAKEIREKREQEFIQQGLDTRKGSRRAMSTSRAKQAAGVAGQPPRWNNKTPKNGRTMRGASTFSSGDRPPVPGSLAHQKQGLGSARTFMSVQAPSRETPPVSTSTVGGNLSSSFGNLGGLRGAASASLQDVTTSEMTAKERSRARTNSAAADALSRSYSLHPNDSSATPEEAGIPCTSDGDDSNYDDVDDPLPASTLHQRMVDSVNTEIDAARMRLMAVEAREWVKAIRQKMMPPQTQSGHEHSRDDMQFEEIFAMPTPAESSSHHLGSEPQPRHSGPPYRFVPGSWTHPPAPLGRLVMSPVWMSFDTPLSLLEFSQVESYLRFLDPATPRSLKWSTLVPARMRIKCGDIRMQLRDFPFPMFRVPDPYRPETSQSPPHGGDSYDSFYGGVEISGSLILAERTAHERSLRSVYIPVGPRSKESGIDLPDVGWYIAKSLQFPRIFAALSIMMYSAPSEDPYADVRLFQQKYLQSRLPQLPIMSTWGASYQPVISALMQRMESATSKSADVSPTLPWWDKLRSRMHVKWRMAVIDAPPLDQLESIRTDHLGDSYLEMGSVGPSLPAQPPPPPLKAGCSSIDPASEKGQMFFLALDGRDPYQVTQKPGGYLFTMRGGVRICINEGIPGADLWDKLSGHGIYSVPTEEGSPPSATLGEFLGLRCEEFLMGVPIIVDRKSTIMKSMDSRQDIGGGDPPGVNITPSTEYIDIEAMPHQSPGGLAGTSATSGPQAWKRSYADLLHSIVSDNSARYTFITHSVDRLYYKVLLHLSGGVRLGIGLSSYIPPDPFGYRHNHWDVQPIAPESAVAAAVGGITDAYVGYRSSKLHTSVSLLCPFTESEPLPQKAFSELYLTTTTTTDLADSSDKSLVDEHRCTVPRLRLPDASVIAKPLRQWSVYDTDALVSPMHSLFPIVRRSMPEVKAESSNAPSAQDLFFSPFPYLVTDAKSPESTPSAFTASNLPPHAAERSVSARPQCRISASAAAVEGIQSYLPLYVSRMMLPVRKGSMYPLAETSDNKLGKCLRSMRLVLDLKNVELAYSQRNFEIKELESRELSILGFEDSTPASSDMGLSPTPSDTNLGQNVSGAKAEGFVRELKARVESFSFNLLLEQTSVKLKVGSGDVGSPLLAAKDASSGNRLPAKGDRARADSIDQLHSRRAKRAPDSPQNSGSATTHTAKTKSGAKAESKALRWGMGDASTEIDYLDVRLTQMSFIMPLFMNSLTSDVLGKSRRLNGLRFADGSLNGLTDFEKSWVSCTSIRDLKELDISEAIFSNPRVVCVLWSPRMVYFTQRPEWTQLDEQLEEILNSGSASPKETAETMPSTQSIPNIHLGGEALGANWATTIPASLDSTVAAMPALIECATTSHLHRSLSAQRSRAISDVKQASQYAHAHANGAGHHNENEDASMWALHRRNMSVPWVLSKQASHDGTIADATSSNRVAPAPAPTLPPASGSAHLSFFGSNPPPIGLAQRASTQPTSNAWNQTADLAAAASQPTDPASGSDVTGETRSPTSAMSYKSSFHLLELARSRQRRLTASNSRQTISIASPSAQPPLDTPAEFGAVDLHRQTSIPIEQTVAGNQQLRMMPTGPDPNVIMRDSRSTQASLLRKRKEMLGTAIQHEQASLVHLSREFERASSRHSEEFRREMIRRAEHIYELGARRKLINRCLRVLGVDPEAANAGQLLADMTGQPNEDDADFDRDTQEVEKVLATLYRHRCLIYSGYLIWTTQVRDELMRFLYIQDCLTAIEYYMSESATKVVRNAMSANGKGDVGDEAGTDAHDGKGKEREASPSADLPADEGLAKHDSIGSGNDEYKSRPPRSGRRSADQRSVASGSSRHTLNIPKMLRRLRSSDRVEDARSSLKGSSGRSFLWRSKKARQGDRSPAKGQLRQPKPLQKPKERRKEEYKPPKHSVGSNKFDKGLKSVWDDFVHYRPYYSILIEFLNSQVSMRVDEKTSTTSAIAVAERVQLHRIMLCNERDCAEDAAFCESGHSYLTPPEDESIVKTRSLIELENVQVFTAKRNDFENQAAYFVDCTYGSQLEGSDASQPSPIWPAWIPIELLLSQGKHRARGIFDELDGSAAAEVDHGFASESGSENDSDGDGRSFASGSFMSDGLSQNPRLYRERRRSKYSKAWWLEDLSKYKRLMDRNNGLVVYDKANPHRIQGDTSDRMGFSATEDGGATNTVGAASAPTPAGDTLGSSGAAAEAGPETNADKAEPSGQRRFSTSERNPTADPAGDNDSGDVDSADEEEEIGSNQGLSHRANHFAVFLPELNLACTAEQYTAIYETVTELIVFIDPEKAAYMDHLNTILLGMDMGDLRGLLAVIRATQQALRERLPIIQDWYTIQRSNAVLFRDASRAMVDRDHWPLLTLDIGRQKARATSLLTLDRHRQALELQLRTAMDLFGAVQKQLRQQSRAADGGRGTKARLAARSTPSSRRPTFDSSTDAPTMAGTNDGEKPATMAARRRMSLLSASSRSSGSQTADGAQNTIARTIHLYISKATWHMLENDGQPLCDMTLRWATLKAVTTSDQATHLLSEVHLLYIVNRLPSPMFTDLVGPYVRPKHNKPDFCVEKMLRVRWSELAPVGGISIVERFEVDLFPLRLQFSHDIAQKLINYLYPPQESAAVDIPEPITRSRRSTFTSLNADGTPCAYTPLAEAATTGPEADANGAVASRGATPGAADRGNIGTWSTGQLLSPKTNPGVTSSGGKSLFAARMRRNIGEHIRGPESGEGAARGSPATTAATTQPQIRVSQSPQPSFGLSATMSGRGSTPLSLFSESNSMINISQSGENRDQVDQMKKRASSNKTFLNIKIGGSTLCISYQGKKTNNITDLRDFEFHAPTLELRNQVESYYELLMQVKKEYMSVVVHHTGALVKEKFRQLHSRKAWNKASFGPDWEARKLLIDMDRRLEEDMVSSVQGSVSDHDGFPPSTLRQTDVAQREIEAQTLPSPVVAVREPLPSEGPVSEVVDDDSASISSAKGKAPVSKYLILDPRKLMGKRLPSVLPRNFARLDTVFPVPGRGEHSASVPPSGSAPLVPIKPGPKPAYSARHVDLFSAASMSMATRSTPSSPLPSIGPNSMQTTEQQPPPSSPPPLREPQNERPR